jgi:hypothetical protein
MQRWRYVMVNYKLSLAAAFGCVPAGFIMPQLFGLKGLEIWPVAIGIWLAGVLISVAELPSEGSVRTWRFAAMWANALLALAFLAIYLLGGSVTAH